MVGLILGLFAIVAVACGGADEDALTAADVQSAVAAAVAAAQQPAAPAGPSAADIQAAVASAVSSAVAGIDIPEGVSASDIQSAVDAATAGLGGGASAADIQAAIDKAVSSAASGLSAADVEAIVSAAVMAIPTPQVITQTIVVAPTEVPKAVAQAINVPSPKNDFAQIIIAWNNVDPGTGLGSSQLDDNIHYIGVGEVTFQATATDTAAPMLATGFTLLPDLSGGTMTIRDDVIFHGQGLDWAGGASWGPMTAADIAYTVNDGNNAINPASIHWQAGDFVTMFGDNPLVAVDATTIEFKFATLPSGSPAYDPRWNANLMNDAAQAFSVQSTNLRDTKGEPWMKDHPLISTGQYQMLEWIQDDKIVVEKVPYDHWSGNNTQVDLMTIKEVPEESTRLALMETGEIDAAFITTKNIPRMVAGGFKTVDNGLKNLVAVIFAGNVWEANNIATGKPLDTAAPYMRELPWIGNPFSDNVDTTTQTLASAEASAVAGTLNDFEQAVLVRNALARAYDRDLINEVVQAGLGFSAYLNQFSPINTNWKSKWEYPYDPAESERLLDLAGKKRINNGNRFDMPLFAPLPGDDHEIADAVSGFFDEVGVKTSVQKYSYSVFRPTIVARSTTLPWVTQCDDGKSTWPWDWPKSQDHTSLTRGGFGCGIEIPVVAQGWVDTAAEPDQLKRILITNKVADYLFEMAISPGIVGQPAPIVYNPNSISAWPMNPGLFSTVTEYENIVPAAR
jgi:hypothetical protein